MNQSQQMARNGISLSTIEHENRRQEMMRQSSADQGHLGGGIYRDHSYLMRASSSPSSSCLSLKPVPSYVTDPSTHVQHQVEPYQSQESPPGARTSKSCDNLDEADKFSNFDAASSEPSITFDHTLTAIEVLRSDKMSARQLSSEASMEMESSPSEKPEPPPGFKDRDDSDISVDTNISGRSEGEKISAKSGEKKISRKSSDGNISSRKSGETKKIKLSKSKTFDQSSFEPTSTKEEMYEDGGKFITEKVSAEKSLEQEIMEEVMSSKGEIVPEEEKEEEEASVYVTALSKTPTSSSRTPVTASSGQSRTAYETVPSDASWCYSSPPTGKLTSGQDAVTTSPSTDEVDIEVDTETEEKTLKQVTFHFSRIIFSLFSVFHFFRFFSNFISRFFL